ncbi:hypothetical protein F2Q70_00026068 [Brassica cretica]|uniref:Uncharacterized protein n=1 Tax=Brassica cretica TaxID=69181 RepID=A0A8S9L9V6_BRACR|nr:hypothetical protein F2Q70_00026068 [Brassica cretica]KAF3576373.1 hypothetical protein DY000_02031525 [Brassica cretica]
MLDARRGRFLLCSLDRTHTQEVGLSELITGLIRFEDFMSETRQGQLLLLVTEIRFGGSRFESHVSFLVSGQASNRLSSRDARKRWPLRFMMKGRVLLPESDLSGTLCEELKRDIEVINIERDIGLVGSYLKREVGFVGSRLGVDVVYSQE